MVRADAASPFARKPLEEAVRETGTSGYRRVLGPVDLTGLGIAAIIGAGIFVSIGRAAALTGPSLVLSYVIAGLACVFAALSFAELAAMVPGSGSAYTYAFVSLGRLPAFLTAWFLVLEYLVGNMFVANGWSAYFTAALCRRRFASPSWRSRADS
jgi:APA family basic amino acid/polyamine antiporter